MYLNTTPSVVSYNVHAALHAATRLQPVCVGCTLLIMSDGHRVLLSSAACGSTECRSVVDSVAGACAVWWACVVFCEREQNEREGDAVSQSFCLSRKTNKNQKRTFLNSSVKICRRGAAEEEGRR